MKCETFNDIVAALPIKVIAMISIFIDFSVRNHKKLSANVTSQQFQTRTILYIGGYRCK